MKKLIRIFLITFAGYLLATSTGCNQNHSHEDHDHEAEEHAPGKEHDHDEDEIIFTPEQARSAGLKTEKVKMQDFEYSIKCSGKILGASGDMRVISAPTSGILQLAKGAISDGMAVSAGQGIYNISSRGLEQGDASTVMKIRYEAAKREYDRALKLLSDKIITQQEFTAVEAEFLTAQAELKSVSGRAAGGAVTVTAPITGYITDLMAQPGEFVSQGTPLFSITRNKRMQLRAEVPQQYSQSVTGITSANIVLPYGDKATYNLSTLNCRKVGSGQSSDSRTGYIPVVFEFDNPGGLLPGAFVETYLTGTECKETISVPVQALTEDQGLYFVFIKIDEHGYRKQEVKPGNSNGSRIEILNGLKSGDEVVTEAVGHLKLAANTGQIPEGHSHNH